MVEHKVVVRGPAVHGFGADPSAAFPFWRAGGDDDGMQNKLLSMICFIAGFASIIASIAIWVIAKDPDPAHGERFGIFVGLWAPTFFILSGRFAPTPGPR